MDRLKPPTQRPAKPPPPQYRHREHKPKVSTSRQEKNSKDNQQPTQREGTENQGAKRKNRHKALNTAHPARGRTAAWQPNRSTEVWQTRDKNNDLEPRVGPPTRATDPQPEAAHQEFQTPAPARNKKGIDQNQEDTHQCVPVPGYYQKGMCQNRHISYYRCNLIQNRNITNHGCRVRVGVGVGRNW